MFRPLAVALLIAIAAGPALADDVPLRINFQSALSTGSGAPAQGTYTLTVRLYAASSGGSALLTQAFPSAAVDGGLVDLTIDPVPSALVEAHGVLWAEVQVNAEAPLPRRPVLPTPFALRSRKADAATSLACTGCVTSAHVGFAWAAADAPGGKATGLACTGCVGGAQIGAGAVGPAHLQAGAVQASHVGFNYAASASKGGPASDVACTGCVGAPEVSFPWAAGTSAGGAAAALDCVGCVTTGQLGAGSVGAAQIKPGAVTDTQLGVNYAASASKGGPASDLGCTQCVESAELTPSLTLAGSITAAGTITACAGSLPGCSLGVKDVMLQRASDQALDVLSAGGVRVRTTANDGWRDLSAGKGFFYGGLQVQGASTLGALTLSGNLDMAGHQIVLPRMQNATSAPVACSVATAGTMYMNTSDARMYYCNGGDWIALGSAVPGSISSPAQSCAHIKVENPAAVDGVYWLKPEGVSTAFQNYCDMTSDGGGWTLVMKIDGTSTVFGYDAALWTNTDTYAPQNFGFDSNQAKLASYASVAMDEVRLGMRTGSTTKWVRFNQSSSSLWSLMKSGAYVQTQVGRNTWKSLIDNSSLQPNCNREGFNAVCGGDTKIRIGILNNQENDCDSCDSRLGFGGTGAYCGQDTTNSCGNTATCTPDNGDRNTKAFGYVFVRRGAVPAGSPGSPESPAASCLAIKSATPGVLDGVYWIAPSGATPFQAYCDMTSDGGGWTLLMKTDGNSGTFAYDSSHWTSTSVVNATAPGLDLAEAKLESFNKLSFTQLRLGMQVGTTKSWLTVNKAGSSLRDVMNGGFQATSLGRNTWKSLVPGASLQPYCNLEGFNTVCGGDTRVRIGIVNNQENDCGSCDSRLGFGAQGVYCGQDGGNSTGNTATCSPDNGDKSIRAFGTIFAR